MGNKQGISAGQDFSDEVEIEEEIPNLNDKKPVQVKQEVEKFMKELNGNLSIGHFDKEQTLKISSELLKYARFTWENSNEDISKKIYSGMSKSGFAELVKILWDLKTKEQVNLDDPKKHANFATVNTQ